MPAARAEQSINNSGTKQQRAGASEKSTEGNERHMGLDRTRPERAHTSGTRARLPFVVWLLRACAGVVIRPHVHGA